MPMRAPYICPCGHRIPAGTRCLCQVRRAKEREASRPSAQARGYTSRWSSESKAFLALPGHERCACGCGRIANMVDHIVAPKGDQTLFWRRSNWQPFNGVCNTRKAIASEGGFGKKGSEEQKPLTQPNQLGQPFSNSSSDATMSSTEATISRSLANFTIGNPLVGELHNPTPSANNSDEACMAENTRPTSKTREVENLSNVSQPDLGGGFATFNSWPPTAWGPSRDISTNSDREDNSQ